MNARITDTKLFPRSEYYTRFEGTTYFAMDNPDYYASYHRSSSTRYCHEMGGLDRIKFSSPYLKKSTGIHSFFAHTGGIIPPFNHPSYSNSIQLTRRAELSDVNVRDALLEYKRKMAEEVVKSFEKCAGGNSQKIKSSGRYNTVERPIVFSDNGYPCVLIMLPVLNSIESINDATKYWAEHPKPFQHLLIASFIAILNVEAMRANIPIEIVFRASFGHNLPSICETDNTFRIHTGVIPLVYARLIGKALHTLNQMINEITDASSLIAPFDQKFHSTILQYNKKKLKDAIYNKSRYKSLRKMISDKKSDLSDSAFDALYKAKEELDKEKKNNKGKASFVRVNLKEKKVWEVIREAGDTMGKSVLTECFRTDKTVDWLSNAVMKAVITNKDKPIEFALSQLLLCLKYKDKVTMDYDKIDSDLIKEKKLKFDCLSFTRFYNEDTEFSKITDMLFTALYAKRPDERLYENLEHAGADFFSAYRGSEIVKQESDNGSDSEFSEDFEVVISESEKFVFSEDYHLSHVKLRVGGGMKAIVSAQFGALAYLKENSVIKTYSMDATQMYYEVESALKMLQEEDIKLVVNKVREQTASILHYDLNHCNSSNAANNKTLSEKLNEFKPTIAILDYTSSTMDEMTTALKECFIKSGVSLVIMVDSGLKNSQGGLDFNPYGEIRIFANNTKTCRFIYNQIKSGLSEQDKLSYQAHEMVRASKLRGLAVDLKRKFEAKDDLNYEDIQRNSIRKKVKRFHDFKNSQKLFQLNDILPSYYQCLIAVKHDSATCHVIHFNGNIIIGYNDGTIEMWDKSLENRISVFNGHSKKINCISILSNGNILSASDDSTLMKWDIESGTCVKKFKINDIAKHLAILPNNNFLVSTTQFFKELDQKTGKCRNNFNLAYENINCIAVSRKGNIITGCSDEDLNNILEEWDIVNNTSSEFAGHHGIVTCLAILPNGNILSGSCDETIKEWDKSTRKCIKTFEGHNEAVTCLAILPNGNFLSGSCDTTIKEWDKSTGECIETLKEHNEPISWIAIHPNASVLSASDDGTLKIWKNMNHLNLRLDQYSSTKQMSNTKLTARNSQGLFQKPQILNQYPRPGFADDQQCIQDYLINVLLKGDLEFVMKLELNGASFLLPNTEGVYPLPAAIYSTSIKAVRYVEDKLTKIEALEQWKMIDVNKAIENIKKVIPKMLSEDKVSDELEVGYWYGIHYRSDSIENSTYTNYKDLEREKITFTENCIKWCVDILDIRKNMVNQLDDHDPVGVICLEYDLVLRVHETVLKAIRKNLHEFIKEIKDKALKECEYRNSNQAKCYGRS